MRAVRADAGLTRVTVLSGLAAVVLVGVGIGTAVGVGGRGGGESALHSGVATHHGRTAAAGPSLVASPATVVRAPHTMLHALLSPDRIVVGIGAPVIVTFDHAVQGRAARAAVLSRLSVRSVPAVAGAWRWMNASEVHYRGPRYWAAGTKVTVTSDLHGLRLPGTRIWGGDTTRTASFSVGDSVVSTVDVTAHTMTVVRNGRVLKTVKVSTGRAKYPTKGGAHIVLLKEREHLYDSSTVGIPIKSPDGYYEKLPWSVRISNSGAFVHANPATVQAQGRINVSHGCVNLSIADAQWFFGITRRGDIVNVVHSAVGPTLSDPGMADWNRSFAAWTSGNS